MTILILRKIDYLNYYIDGGHPPKAQLKIKKHHFFSKLSVIFLKFVSILNVDWQNLMLRSMLPLDYFNDY